MKKFKLCRLVTTATIALTSIVGFGSLAVQAQESKDILVYSNSLSDGRSDFLVEQAAEAGFNVLFVDAGAGEIQNRLLAEKGAPQADVTYGLDESIFLDLKENDILVPHIPAWIDEVPEETNIGDGYFHPLVEQRIFMVYNPEFLTEDEIPSNWQDLAANESFANRFRVPDGLGSGTNQKALLSILLQYVDESGELGIAQEGWDAVEDYLHTGYMTPASEDINTNFKNGTMPISYFYSSGVPFVEEEFGFEMIPINPEQGVITMREQIGVVNKGENHDYTVAQEFVDWFGAAEMQGMWAEEFGSLPVNLSAIDSAQPRMKKIAEATMPMDVDWTFVRTYLADWIEKIELDLMP